jgi:electron transfer flavoprotein beta subunit
VVGIGPAAATKEIRSGLAMGADSGILVVHDGHMDSFGVAAVLKKIADEEKPDLILMGKQAVDGDDNQAGQILAEMLGWPQACFASKIELSADLKSAKITREVDGGLDHVDVVLPAVITAELRLNEPRYASLPGIMKAKKKPLKEVPLAQMGVDTKPRVIWHKFSEPAQRKAGIVVPDVLTLVQKLHNEAKVF